MEKKMYYVFLKRAALAFILLFAGFEAWAITISIAPNSQTVNQGDSVTTELVISDLAPGGSPSLAEFDLNLTFNPGVLSIDTTDSNGDFVIDSVVLDPTGQLDIFGLNTNIISADLISSNTLNLYDLSFDLPADLDTNQLGSFVLASITFQADTIGTSPLDISINSLGDALGNPLTASIQNGSVTVTAVPVVPALWLFLSGLGVIAFKKRES